MYTLIGLILIVLGAAFILFMPSGNKPQQPATDASTTESKDSAAKPENDEEKKEADANAAKNRNAFLQTLTAPGNLPPVRIYFGSQTGTAEKFSNVLDEEAQLLGIEDCKVIDFNNFVEDDFGKQPLVITVVATHYEGDPCDNTRNFFKYLKKSLKDKVAKPFSGMAFTIFGLGDTSYEQYNEMGRVFDESFEKLGGSRVHEMSVGNAETFSTEDDFNKWKENLWTKIFEHYAKSESGDQKKKALLKRRSSLLAARNIDPSILPWVVDESDIQLADNTSQPEYDMNMRNYLSSKPLAVKEIRELRQQTTEGGSTLEVIFDLKGTGLTYITAANSAIYATNTAEDVEKFAKMFSLNLDTTFVFSKNAEFTGKMPKMPFPTGTSISFREALTKHIDFTAPISKKMLTAMAPLCEAKEDRELLESVVATGSKKYDELFQQRNLGLIDIKTVVPSLNLTAGFIFQKCNLIMPRYYTIASSSLAHPQELMIAVSLSRYEVSQGDGTKVSRNGLVSGYLESIFKQSQQTPDHPIQAQVMCFVKDSNFSMPATHDVPMFMVGPGTGVVPFIGFMQEREKARQNNGELTMGTASLFFGCRRHDQDFIYRDEMHAMKDQGIISELNLAFSRPVEAGSSKTYVQDLLGQQRELVKKVMVEQKGQFFVCGATSMGKAVEALVKEICGEEEFKAIQKEKRYKVELWSS